MALEASTGSRNAPTGSCVSIAGEGQDRSTLASGVPVSELVVPLVLLAVLLLVGAVVLAVVLRRRRPRMPTPTPGASPAATSKRTPRLQADRGTDLARPEQLGIRTLTPAERQRYVTAWQGVQERAGRQPALALSEADAVVERLLRDCGYPVDDPRAPGDVVPGRHAEVLASFRAGHSLEQVNSSTRSDPEQVRQALAHFSAAFDAVVADGTPAYPDAPRLLSAEAAATHRPQPGR